MIVRSFAPIAAPDARTLILGSMPGVASLDAGEYYAHPRNAFWPIMGALYGAGPDLPYTERVTVLKAAGIAVWDVLQSCVREGSLDADIRGEVPNDFACFFAAHPGIRCIGLNGGKAAASFRNYGGVRASGHGRPRLALDQSGTCGTRLCGEVRDLAGGTPFLNPSPKGEGAYDHAFS